VARPNPFGKRLGVRYQTLCHIEICDNPNCRVNGVGWHRLTRSGYRCAAGRRRLLAVGNRRRFAEWRSCLLVCNVRPERKHFPRLLVADATQVVAALQPGASLRRLCRPMVIRSPTVANRVTFKLKRDPLPDGRGLSVCPLCERTALRYFKLESVRSRFSQRTPRDKGRPPIGSLPLSDLIERSSFTPGERLLLAGLTCRPGRPVFLQSVRSVCSAGRRISSAPLPSAFLRGA